MAFAFSLLFQHVCVSYYMDVLVSVSVSNPNPNPNPNPWVEKVSNAEVLRRAGVQQDLVLKIIHRQISFIGHVLRKGQLELLT